MELSLPIIVFFTGDLWELIINDYMGKDWEYKKVSLLGAVPFVQFIYAIIRKISR